jgi:hypothetical protein
MCYGTVATTVAGQSAWHGDMRLEQDEYLKNERNSSTFIRGPVSYMERTDSVALGFSVVSEQSRP